MALQGFFRSGIKLFFLFFLVSFHVSCVTQRKVEYLQSRDKALTAYREAEFSDYRLKSNDELYIQISSLDEAANNMFFNANQQQFFSLGTIQPYGASLMAYSVDREGYLLLPVIGKVYVMGKTLPEVSSILQDSLKNILSQPAVTVKLVNRFISVLGEVNNPGHFPYSQERITIYDALGMAGDINDYGNRSEVILIRNDNHENFRVKLNLTSSDILSSRYFSLRPNDIIYVKPLRHKFWGMRQFPYEVIFSTITTGLLIYNVMK